MATRKQAQLCLVTYQATSGRQVHAVVTAAQRILLAQIGRLTVDHGLVDHGIPTPELRDAMTALRSIAGTADLATMHVPKPHPWDLQLPEPTCTCRVSGLGRVVDPCCQIHGGDS